MLRPTFRRPRSSPPSPKLSLLLAGIAMMTLGCGDADTPTGPEAAPVLATSATAALTFRMVAAGGWHSCGVTIDNKAYCWGLNGDGRLGDGTINNRSRPTLVAGGHQFVQVSGGYFHTCGVTTDNLAYCWGRGQHGQLGYGGSHHRVRPVPVTGGLHFQLVTVGPDHSCGLTTDNRAYCWGSNYAGQLGDGTTTERKAPVPVAGGLRFRRIKAAGYSCGVTTTNRAYCWGGEHLVPTAIPGGLSFQQVTAGCGLTSDHKGYCWNNYGQPQALAGGLSWNQVVVGLVHSCGVTTANRAYCWGDNFTGALGDGTETSRVAPTAVVGGLLFDGVSPGMGDHSCAVSTTGRAYCWGHNAYGQLGNGSNTGPQTCYGVLPCSTQPVAVIRPS
jgi:alpha-tubulin suppressor-like RCC1 family protein